MSISLIGIVLVQFFWVKQAIEVQQVQVSSAIYDALNTTVKRLEMNTKGTSYLKMKGLYRKPHRSKNHRGTAQNRNQTPIPPFRTQVSISKDGTFLATAQFNFADPSEYDDDDFSSPKENGDAANELDLGNSTFDPQSREQQQQILEWFTQMNNEFTSRLDPLKGRLDLTQLPEILTDELAQRGLKSKFEYGVIDKATLAVTQFHSAKFNPSEQFNIFVVPLFPKDIFRGYTPYALQVNFFNISSLAFTSLGYLMIASMMFTIFILVAFFLTVRTILSQKRVSEIKNDFINNMTHEFKTPIATISLASDSISNASIIDKPERIAPLLSIIKEENKRMNKQVERILQMSLLEKRDFQLAPTNADANLLITKVVDKMRLLAEKRGGSITIDLQAKNPAIWVDEVHFTNVIHNLIDNAIKYTLEPPKIEVSTKSVAKGIEIAVADNGVGLSKEEQGLIFEKFYRVHTGNQHNIKGFGLGLSYVKAIVQLHSGEIKISSKLGVGSTFYITIPNQRAIN